MSYKLGPKMSILRDPYVYIRYLREKIYLMPEAYTMQALKRLRTYKSTGTGCPEKIAERAFSFVYLKVLIIHLFYRILWQLLKLPSDFDPYMSTFMWRLFG